MENYPSNAERPKAVPAKPKQERKKVEPIITSEVVRRKKSLGKRFHDMFFGENAKTTIMAAILPAARDALSDAATSYVDMLLYGESRSRSRRAGVAGGILGSAMAAHTAYNRYAGSTMRPDPRQQGVMSHRGRATHDFDEIVLSTRAEAEEVISRLIFLLEQYQSVSVADLYDLLNQPTDHPDFKWGWFDLRDARVDRVSQGYLLNLPKPVPLD